MRGISWLAASQLAAQEGLCTMEGVSKYLSIYLLLTRSSTPVTSTSRMIGAWWIVRAFFQQRFSVHVWCALVGYNMTGPRVIDGTHNGSVLQKFSGKWSTPFIQRMRPLGHKEECCYNMARHLSSFRQRVARIFERTLWRKRDWKKRTSCLAGSITRLQSVRLLSLSLREVEIVALW